MFKKNRIWLPHDDDLIRKVVYEYHDKPQVGHPGFCKTWLMVKEQFYNTNLRKYIKKYIRECDICQRIKNKPESKHRLQPTELADLPWEHVFVDFLGPLPKDRRTGMDMIMVISDKVSKQMHCIPTIQEVSAEHVAELYLEHVWKIHGIPTKIILDRGLQFSLRFMKKLLEHVGSHAALSTAYHPQTDGQSERLNQELEIYLRAFINYRQDDWVCWLPVAEFAHNVKPHSATGRSPFEIIQGFNPPFTVNTGSTALPRLDERLAELKQVREEANAAQTLTAQEMIKKFNKNPEKVKTFKIGDKVLIDGRNIKTSRPSKKLDHKRYGPFKIVKRIGDVSYELELPKELRALHNVFHTEKLVPYYEDTIPGRKKIPSPPIEIEGENEYEVASIIDSRRKRGRLEYLVTWKGYGPEDNTWEPIKNLGNAKESIERFYKENPSAAR